LRVVPGIVVGSLAFVRFVSGEWHEARLGSASRGEGARVERERTAAMLIEDIVRSCGEGVEIELRLTGDDNLRRDRWAFETVGGIDDVPRHRHFRLLGVRKVSGRHVAQCTFADGEGWAGVPRDEVEAVRVLGSGAPPADGGVREPRRPGPSIDGAGYPLGH